MLPDALRRRVQDMMPQVLRDLENLIRYPSISFPGFPAAPMDEMATETMELLRRYGLDDVHLIDIPGGYPAVYGEIPAAPGAPVVLCYAHYDVQPARKEGWTGDPWSPEYRGGRLHGRGAADDKAGILMIAASLSLLQKNAGVRVKVFIEGGEEGGPDLSPFIAEHPELFSCNLFLIDDIGSLLAGEPAISTSLRGEAACRVAVSTLQQGVHSGTFGGAAPDALMALIHILSNLLDAEGNPAVSGLTSFPEDKDAYPVELFRRTAGVLDGVDLWGMGPISSRLWCQPSVNVIGIDAPPTAGATNALIPKASAIVSLRIPPGADPDHELNLLMTHLRKHTPWHVRVDMHRLRASPGFICPTGGPFFAAACRCLESAYGKPAREIGSGGTIPLLNALRKIAPQAEFILWGCEDQALSHIHGEDESVDTGEVERMILAQSLLLQTIGEGKIP